MSEPGQGRELLKKFEDSVQSERIEGSLLLDYSSLIFAHATRVFDAGSVMGTAILCRSALETAFFLFVTWNHRELRVDFPRFLNGKRRNVGFQELKTAIAKKIEFSPTQLKAIERVQDDGNLIAHFASRRLNEVAKFGTLLASSKLLEARTPAEWRNAIEGVESKLKISLNRDQALADLKDTFDILLTVLRAFRKTESSPGA